MKYSIVEYSQIRLGIWKKLVIRWNQVSCWTWQCTWTFEWKSSFVKIKFHAPLHDTVGYLGEIPDVLKSSVMHKLFYTVHWVFGRNSTFVKMKFPCSTPLYGWVIERNFTFFKIKFHAQLHYTVGYLGETSLR